MQDDGSPTDDAAIRYHVLLYRLAEKFGIGVLALPFDQAMLLAHIMAEDAREQERHSSASNPKTRRG